MYSYCSNICKYNNRELIPTCTINFYHHTINIYIYYAQCHKIAVGPFIIACNRDSLYLRVNKEFQVEATEKYSEASNFYIVRLDEDRYFSIVYEVSNVDDLDESIKRKVEEECGKHKPGISLYLSASVNWRGRSFKNKPLQMQMSGKRFLTQMALQSRRLKHFQPAKLTEWTSGKDIFFIRCRKRTTSGTQRSDSYLCVRKHRVKKPVKTRNARVGYLTDMSIEISSQGKDDSLEEKASPSKEDQPAQDNNDQSKESKATESSKGHKDIPEGEATQTGQGEDDRAEEKSSQGSIQQEQGESSQGIEQAVEETSQSKEEIEGKSSKENIEQAKEKAIKSQKNDDQSDEVLFELFEAIPDFLGRKKHRDYGTSYSVGCEPRIDKHNDEDTFMLFRLLKPKIKKSMYLKP